MDVVSLALTHVADALAASTVMRSFVAPLMAGLCVAASLGCTFFLVVGGVQYMSSRGRPETLEYAKHTIKNALIGLSLVLAAATLTALLVHAYSASAATALQKLPSLDPVNQSGSNSLFDIVIKAITHVLQAVIDSLGQPFVQSLAFFTKGTPLMGDNSAVFNMWLVMVGISDVLFAVAIALLGFHVMSFSTLGFEELDIKKLLPQLALVFALINTSLFAIDGIISLSNVMVHALQAAFPPMTIWDLLTNLTKQSSGLGLGALLIMVAFLVLAVLLLVYYVLRLIMLYVGAAMSPVVLLLYMLPAFRDIAVTAAKVYLMNIFVLFVQVVIMQIASSLFLGLLQGTNSGQPNTLMALIVGVATMWSLLKTPGVMKELSFAASLPRAFRELGVTIRRTFSGVETVTTIGTKVVKQLVHLLAAAYERVKNRSKDPESDDPGRSPKPPTGQTWPAADYRPKPVKRRADPVIEGAEA